MLRRDSRRRPGCGRTLMGGVLIAFVVVSRATAHEGPPFPILMDRSTAHHVVSVWADPDIGEASFYIVVESRVGGPPRETPDVSMWIQPVNGRLERMTYPAKRQSLRNRIQFQVKPYFDQRDMWNVGIRITGSDGLPEQLLAQVESTPPGTGPWDLAIYLFPFLLFGGLWAMAMARRCRMPQRRDPSVAALRRKPSARDGVPTSRGVEDGA